MLSPLDFVHKVKYLYIIGILCAAFCIPILSYAQDLAFETNFSDPSLYTLNAKFDCDSNPGIFEYTGGRFTINDMEGRTCGLSDNQVNFNGISISGYTNLTITLNYTVEDRGDGFECASVFGNGDDQIRLSYSVDGTPKGPLNVFCEDTGPGITSSRKAQFSIPDGNNLNITITAGNQAPSEFFYLDNIKVSGRQVAMPVDPPPPPDVGMTGMPFQTESSNIQCISNNSNILPSIMVIYADHSDGKWSDADGVEISEIVPSTLIAGIHLFRYTLPDGNISEFSLTVIDDQLGNPILGPYCESDEIIDLPRVVNSYEGSWQGTGTSGTRGLELRLGQLQQGDNNRISFTFENSGCGVDYNVDLIAKFEDIEITSCPPGIINLVDSIPNLSKLVEEIDFRDFSNSQIANPESVNMADYPGPLTTFIHELPVTGCKNNNEVAVLVDTSCPNTGAPPSAVISINRDNGIICEGDCGEITVDITEGVAPYEIEFEAEIEFSGGMQRIPFFPTSINGSQYTATICSDPSISIADLIFRAISGDWDVIYDSNINRWNIPTEITSAGTIRGWVIDANRDRVPFANEIPVQAFAKPIFPDFANVFEACLNDVQSFTEFNSTTLPPGTYNWYNGDPNNGGTEITDFSTIDLTNLWAEFTETGCFSDPNKIDPTVLSASDAVCADPQTCITPPTPEFVEGVANQLWCNDGSFQGFRVRNDGEFADYQFEWFDATNNTRIQENNISFDPGVGVTGDFFVTAVDPDDATCRSNPLNFSFNYYEPRLTNISCDVIQNGVVIDFNIGTDERIARIEPNVQFVRNQDGSWRLLSAQPNTDYDIIIQTAEATDRCEVTYTLRSSDYTCVETCNTAGENVTEFIDAINTTIDLGTILRNNEGPVGIFVDENNNEVSNPYTFTEDVTLYHVIVASGNCPEDRALISLRLTGGSIDGNVCADPVFCDEISIVLSSGTGAGAPYTMRFEMFDAAVIQEIVFEPTDLLNDTTLVVTVCVNGTENIYNATSKTLFIAEGTPAGTIRVTELRDRDEMLLGSVPPIDVDFSPLPVVTTIDDIVDVCMLESNEFPIRDLNDQIITNNDDVIEWWYEQPSDPDTEDSDKVQGDAAVNPNDVIYALVTSPDNCKVEVPVQFTLVNDDFVDVAYDQFYCDGDPVIPTLLEDNGFNIDFNYSPKTGNSRINRATGEISDPVLNTEYTISWITTGACPVSDSTKVTVLAAGDERCNCPTIDPPIIEGTDVPPQPALEGNGISYCFDADRPSFVVNNNPGNLDAVWYASRALTTVINTGDEYADGDTRVNYFVRFEDASGCASELTPVFTIINQGQRLSSRNISFCSNTESSVNLETFLNQAEGFTVDWTDPLGNPILDPRNYTGDGLPRNEILILDQAYTDPDGCGDETQVQFTITDYDSLSFDNFICNAAENFYTLEFEAPSHFRVSSSVGSVSESEGVWLVDSVAIGTPISLSITDDFLACPFDRTIQSPSCDCDGIPDPRDIDLRDTICFGDQFEIFNSNGDFEVNWYDVPTGGIRLPNNEIFEGIVSGTFYAEIVDRASSCVSERKPFVVLDFVPSPLRDELNEFFLITCEELQDSFFLASSQPEYSVVWLDNDTREIIHEGESFRPDETEFPPGVDYNFIAAYQSDFGCISTVGQALTYRIYARPNFTPIDTICSADLRSVTFEFDTRGVVLAPIGTARSANGNFEIRDIPIDEDVIIEIGREQTGVTCTIMRPVSFDPTSTCPCPDIPDPDSLGPSAETVCSSDTDFEFEIQRISIDDVVASWYDNENAAGDPLLFNSTSFMPPDSGAYYVQLIDTITMCTSDIVQLNLFYDDVPNAGEGMTETICGVDSIDLVQYLIAPYDEGGDWTDEDGNPIGSKISALNFATDRPLSFFYTVTTTNVVPCSDAAEVILTLQAPFNAGINSDVPAICDQSGMIIDFDAEIGPHDPGAWDDNGMTGIDLNDNPVVNSSDIPSGDYIFTFRVLTDNICDSEISDVRVTILPLPDVGIDTRDTICEGEEFGYNFVTALDGVSDPLGSWEDVDSRLPSDINDNPGSVDLNGLRAGDYIFRYALTTGGCSASSDLLLHVRESNYAGQDTLVQICNDNSLSLNFERVLPDANGYDLSIEGGHVIDFSQPQNVDFSSLPIGEYRIINTANSISSCTSDEATVTFVIEGSKIPPPLDEDFQVCFGDTVDLRVLVATGGVFDEVAGLGALEGDSLFTGRLPSDDPYTLTYVITPDSVCAPIVEDFTVTPISAPNAGGDGSSIICQGDSIDLFTLLSTDADLGGVFRDIETTDALNGSIVSTENLDETTYSFSYEVGDGSICPTDVSIINLDVRETPELPDTLDYLICEDELLAYNFLNGLGQLDLTGEWLNPDNIAADFSDPSAVDISQLEVLRVYEIAYTLTNGNCADTALVIFQIDESVYPGQEGAFLAHCEGEQETIDLFSLLDDEDQGMWFDQDGNLIADPTNFNLGDLAADNYNFKHKVVNNTLGFCSDDSVSVQILVEPAPDAGEDQGTTLCQNVTFDLQTLIDAGIDQNGIFEDQDGHGNLVGTMVDAGSMAPGDYSYYYVLETNTSCPPSIAVITLTVVSDISAGDSSSDMICQGDPFDLESLLVNADTGGRFENADTQTPYADTDLVTADLSGTQTIWYIVESSSCESDTVTHTLDINIIPDLGDDIDFIECQSDASSINFLNQLGTRDQTGQWLDPNNTGLNFDDPTAVDLSGLTALEPNTVKYTVGNGDCSDTIDVVFTLDKSLFAGEAGVTDSHCFGRARIVNLYDYFTDEDQGQWSLNGEPIDDATAFDFSQLADGSYTFSHSVSNVALGVCPVPPVQTVELIVYPAAFAGADIEQTLCQNIDFDLMTILDGAADNGGVFIDSDDNVIGSEITTTGIPEGEYTYEYIVQGNANCDADTAAITITVVSEIDAGEQNGDEVCQGTDFDLTTLIMNGDPGGRFEDVGSGRVFADPTLNTDVLLGDIDIRYIVDSPSCESDTTEYVLTVNPVFDEIEEFKIAEGDSVLINDIWYKTDQTLVFNGTTVDDCDSTVTTIITVSDVSVVATGVSCTDEEDGVFTISINAGIPSFDIQINQIDGGINSVGGTLLRYGDLSFGDLSVGDYSVMILDGNGESVFDDTLAITIDRLIIPTVESLPASCFGFTDGSLEISEILIGDELQSLGAYTFAWSSGDMTSSTGKLGGGFHQIVITDTMTLCPYEFEYFVEEPEALLVDTMITDFQCGGTGGSITLDLLSDIGDLAEWSLDGGPIQSIPQFTNLDAGFYSVTIEYGECSQTFENLEVKEASDNIIEIEPNDLELIVGQEEQINVLINFQDIDVEWTSEFGLDGLDITDPLNPVLTAVDTNEYVITVTDGFGCTVMDTLRVNVTEWQDPIPDIYIPNVFNPEDPAFGIFKPFIEDNYPGTYRLSVFNRWGNTVHESNNEIGSASEGWDGTQNGKLVEIGVYTYIIEFNFDNGSVFRRMGDVTVLY